MEIKVISGAAIDNWLPHLARLRIRVFKAFPYLYDGDASYEQEYLSVYSQSEKTIMVIVLDGDRVVGASSGMPLQLETDEIKAPFKSSGFDPEKVFYFGESVLLESYRGMGLGKCFFAEREKHATSLGYVWAAFCSVIRPENHPLQPADYRPLDGFWINQGYKKRSDLKTKFIWKDLNESNQQPKEMVFWIKQLEKHLQ